MSKQRHHDGPGLKVLSKERWYGGGSCGICGDWGKALIPQSVRYWDPDDGWRVGVLCAFCGEEAARRGPRPDDYASQVRSMSADPDAIDVSAALGDMESVYSDHGQP